MDEKAYAAMKFGRLAKAGTLLLVILSAFFLFKTINEIKTGATIGYTNAAVNTIVVSGTGEIMAKPDIATFTFTVDETAPTASAAQKLATDKSNKVLAYLKQAGIADKDIQTNDYSSNPKYEYVNGVCNDYSCTPSKQNLVGYEVTQSVSVKVRDISKAGDILSGVGEFDVQNLGGLSFSLENQKALEKQARQMAIADARAQAESLAADLGVQITRIVGYSEQGNYPIVYAAKAMMLDSAAGAPAAAPAPVIPAGENKITSNVSVTYEIR